MSDLLNAMNIAASSLNLQQMQANTIANNIANASTPGYVTEQLPQSELLSGGTGAGVTAGTLQRLGDEAAAAVANTANSAQSYSQTMVNGLTNYVNTVGQPTDSTSLPEMLSAFNTALTTLSTTPSDPTAQTSAVSAAQGLAGTLNTLSTAVDSAREQADQAVATGVAQVNSTLAQLGQNQLAMQKASAAGESIAPYQDTQDTLLATLSNDLPIQVTPNGTTGITVTTDQGTMLFDGTAHDLSFTATPNITPTMSVTANAAQGTTGGLSQVTVDGQPIQMSQSGSIAADLQLRDGTLANFSNQLDQVAGNLITAFQNADPTVSAGQTGLFTNAGAALASGTPVAGLAGSIAVNAAVDPAQGGQTALIQSGVQATSQSDSGDNSTVLAFISAMQQQQSYDTSSGLPGSMNLGDATSEVAGVQQAALSNWTSTNTTLTTQAQAAQTTLTSQTGVSVDSQLQSLMVVQQTYAATAQVLQAAATMLDALNQIH